MIPFQIWGVLFLDMEMGIASPILILLLFEILN